MVRRIALGRIVAPHGVRGEVKIQSYTAEPKAIAAYGALSDRDGGRRFVLTLTGSGKGVVLAAISGIADRNAAAALKGVELFVERDRLPAEALGAEEFYQADLIGLAVELPNGERLGEVVALANFGAGDLLEVRPSKGTTIFVPFTRDVVPLVDLQAHRLVVDPPLGLLENETVAGEEPER